MTNRSQPTPVVDRPGDLAERAAQRDRELSFVLIGDRTGQARPGVFERALAVTNLLRPEFAIQLGDLIEGYTDDADELAQQWAEIDDMTAALTVPLFRTPGNHDLSNTMMAAEWARRHGPTYRAVVHREALFLLLDTQDPPMSMDEFAARHAVLGERLTRLRELVVSDPQEALRIVDAMTDWEGTMPARISAEQVDWAESVIAEHRDVRWTFLCLHMPAWQGDENDGFARIRRSLGRDPYTAFAGHVHNYQRTVIDGRDHIRLGPSGGVWVRPGEAGNWDHVTQVTLTDTGPTIVNVLLDGVLPVDGGVFAPPERLPLGIPG